MIILGAGYVFRQRWYLKLAAKNSRVNMREKIYNHPKRMLHLQRHKIKVREIEVFGNIDTTQGFNNRLLTKMSLIHRCEI